MSRASVFLLACLLVFGGRVPADTPLQIFDGHIHYSEDVWEALPPQRALELLSEAGIARALVSATPGQGAEKMYRAAPDRIVPFLRPYPTRAHRYTWFDDATVPGYLREQLARVPYRGIGEFHLPGEKARTPVVAELVALARERRLALHAHTDRTGIIALLDQAPDIPVIWAHGGFDVPVSILRDLLAAHEQLLVELSFREGLTEAGELTPAWRSLMTDHPGRFLTGMDTYSPTRWVELPDLAREARGWLRQLPEPVAQAVASGNAARLFPVR